MTCTPLKLPGGVAAIVCTRGVRAKRCKCKNEATRLCDWKVEGGTCDAALCPRCTYEPVTGKDLCAKHAKEWLQRQQGANE